MELNTPKSFGPEWKCDGCGEIVTKMFAPDNGWRELMQSPTSASKTHFCPKCWAEKAKKANEDLKTARVLEHLDLIDAKAAREFLIPDAQMRREARDIAAGMKRSIEAGRSCCYISVKFVNHWPKIKAHLEKLGYRIEEMTSNGVVDGVEISWDIEQKE